jgi:ankyrin repeat protein
LREYDNDGNISMNRPSSISCIARALVLLACVFSSASCADPERKNEPTPVMLALLSTIAFGSGEDVTKALREHPDLIREYEATHNGATLLDYAAQTTSNTNVMKALVSFGLDPTSASSSGVTPLHLAAFAYNYEGCLFLLDHGAKVNAVDKDGDTPFTSAINRAVENDTKNVSVVELILSRGGDPTIRGKDGWGWIDYLNRSEELSCATALLDLFFRYKFDFSAKNKDGETIFHLLVEDLGTMRWRQQLINILLQHNVSPFVKNTDGVSVYDLAKEKYDQKYADSLVPNEPLVP